MSSCSSAWCSLEVKLLEVERLSLTKCTKKFLVFSLTSLDSPDLFFPVVLVSSRCICLDEKHNEENLKKAKPE